MKRLFGPAPLRDDAPEISASNLMKERSISKRLSALLRFVSIYAIFRKLGNSSDRNHLPRQFIFHVFSFLAHFPTGFVANAILFTALFET